MSRAEEKAEEYCNSTLVGSSYIKKMAYIAGYHQAEEDLLENKHEKSWRLEEKLWENIKDLEEASYQYTYDASNDWAYEVPTWDDVQDAFKAGSEWKENFKLTVDDIEKIHNLIKQLQINYTDTRGCYQEIADIFNKERE